MRALVVGYGVMGHHHARTLRALGIDVVTVDPHAPADHRSLLGAPTADVACIATPPEDLAGQAADALMLGLDVLVEKPMALSIESAEALLEVAEGKKLRVGYTERHNPALREFRQRLALIGRLRHITIRRLGLPKVSKVGPALDLMTHDLDVLRYLGFVPESIEYSAGVHGHVTCFAKLPCGTATLEASHIHPTKERTLTAVGDAGMLSLDYQRQVVVFRNREGSREFGIARDEPLKSQWRAFFRGQGVTGEEAMETLRLALRVEHGSEVFV